LLRNNPLSNAYSGHKFLEFCLRFDWLIGQMVLSRNTAWLLSLVGIVFTSSCSRQPGPNQTDIANYVQVIKSASKLLPYALEMEEQFPSTDHFITHFGFDSGPGPWNSVSYFGQRYNIHMKQSISIDYKAGKISGRIGEPQFYLFEIDSIEVLPDGRMVATFRTQSEKHFGATEWKQFRDSGYNLSALGIVPNGSPVVHFDEYVRQMRAPLLRVRLIE